MKCCVIGFGAAGIIAAKFLKDASIDFDVFEKMDDIGGTWVYTEEETDSLGTPIHSSMYKNLRTNLPKELMKFGDLDFDIKESFIKSIYVYKYLKLYVDKHLLMKNVKLGHLVNKVSYVQGNWQVIVKDIKNKTENTLHYDKIIVCNGHFNEPSMPHIAGQNDFKGLQIHSKAYRTPEVFKNKTLLVIGYSYSGQDIAHDVSKVASKVYLSHHAVNYNADYFRDNVISKPDVKTINQNSVTFEDGTTEDINVIIYCTGYLYTFPFLDESCGIQVDDNYVKPLYKQIININHPSMAFIGLQFFTFIFPLFEMQAETIVKIFLGKVNLPDEEDMRKDLKLFEQNKVDQGIRKKDYHRLADNVRNYIKELNKLGDIEDLPEVAYKIFHYVFQTRREHIIKYRDLNYEIINDNEFLVHENDGIES